MSARLRVDGKSFEFCGLEGGCFPFTVSEMSSRRTFFIRLAGDKFRWLATELVQFCSSEGDPFWMRSYKEGNGYLLLQLKRKKGVDSLSFLFANFGKSRTIIFPARPKAEVWFGVTKTLKGMLVLGYEGLSFN